MTRQLDTAAIDSRLHRTFRQPEARGDLLVRQALDVAKQNRQSQCLSECEHSLSQELAAVKPLQTRKGVQSFRLEEECGRVDVAVDELPFPTYASVVVDAKVATDANQPRLKVRSAIERGEGLVDLEKDILGQILRFVVFTDEGVRDIEDATSVSLDNSVPRGLVTAQARVNQLIGGGLVRRRGIHGTAVYNAAFTVW